MSDPGPPFRHAHAALDGLDMHYVTLGQGAPLVLLHGWPQSWFEWRELMPLLADRYELIAPDLRGLGDSSRPAAGYDTDTLAADVWALVNGHLGHERFAVAGHDWGGPVAFALAAAHRDAVSRLAILDVAIPGDGAAAGLSQGGRRWHHALHMTPGLPEALAGGREDVYLGWFYDNFGATPQAISDAARAEYLRTYRDPAALHAGFEYYRNIPLDCELNARHLRRGRLDIPVLALGGGDGWGRGSEVLESCRRVATTVSGGVIAAAGHWLPEEQPQAVAARLREFLRPGI